MRNRRQRLWLAFGDEKASPPTPMYVHGRHAGGQRCGGTSASLRKAVVAVAVKAAGVGDGVLGGGGPKHCQCKGIA